MVGATFFGVDNYRAGHMAGAALGAVGAAESWNGRIDQLLVLEEPRAGSLPEARIQGQLDGLQERSWTQSLPSRFILSEFWQRQRH